jgi:hypothetical protein
MNEFKLTFITQGTKIMTEKKDFSKIELNTLNSLLRERNITDLNIIVKSKRRACGNKSFVDFESSNNLTIRENLERFLNEDTDQEIYERTINFNKKLLKELNEVL